MNKLESSNEADLSKEHAYMKELCEKMSSLKTTLSKCRREHLLYATAALGVILLGAFLALFRFSRKPKPLKG